MRGAPTVRWTCDKCGDTDTRIAEHGAPAGWRKVVSSDIDSKGTERSRADWCGSCVRSYLGPLVWDQEAKA